MLDTLLVEVGDHVEQGQPIAYPMKFYTWKETYGFDWWLWDMARSDGVWADQEEQRGCRVPPYEYLEPSVKEAVEQAYRENMYDVYKYEGRVVGNFNPYEPYLVNEIFLHRGNEGTPIGVWISLERRWDLDGVPDMVTIMYVDNEFYKGYRFIFLDGWGSPTTTSGYCEVNLEAGEITFHVDWPEQLKGAVYYGIFEVIEDGRSQLRLEYRQGSRPASFSDQALTFVVRSQLEPRREVREKFPDLPPL